MSRRRARTTVMNTGALFSETWRGGPPPYSAFGVLTQHPAEQVPAMYEQIDDVVTPNLRKRIAAGEIIMNPMSLQRWVRGGPVNIDFIAGPWPSWFNGGWEHYWGDASPMLDGALGFAQGGDEISERLAGRALLNAYAKLNRPALNSQVLTAEFAETVGMLRRPFSSARSLLAKMRKYRQLRLGKTARSAAKATSDTWLEYRYGWRPVIMDGKAIIALAMKKYHNRMKSRLISRGGAEDTTKTVSDLAVTIYGALEAVGHAIVERHYRAAAGVIYQHSASSASNQRMKDLGLQLTAFPSTVWEVIPYSFVADWFYNVGTWIAAYTPNPDVETLSNWVTIVIETEQTFSGSLRYTWEGTFTGFCPSYHRRTSLVERRPNQALPPLPVRQVETLSMPQKLDAIAMLSQQIVEQLKLFKR